MLPPLIAVVPAASVIKLVKAFVPPTMPPKVVVPAVFTVKPTKPFKVLAKLIAPLPLETRVVLLASVTASL